MTLYALTDIEAVNSANVNVLTHLEKSRVEYLVKQQRMSFSVAKKQAQREVLAIFGFEPSETSSEALDLTADAKLLAISCILQGYLSTGDMMELMANINADIKEDGKLDNMVLGSKLMNNAHSVNLSIAAIHENLTKKYAELGINVTIPDFESYVQSFIDSDLYPLTALINYPATGLYGINILADNVTEVEITDDEFPCSMRAEVPSGLSLTIILRGDADWFYEWEATVNWTISTLDYDPETEISTQIFTVKESGKISDMELLFDYSKNTPSYITIEYYENGATTPTKTKILYFKEI
jgi:hypothetical protein